MELSKELSKDLDVIDENEDSYSESEALAENLIKEVAPKKPASNPLKFIRNFSANDDVSASDDEGNVKDDDKDHKIQIQTLISPKASKFFKEPEEPEIVRADTVRVVFSNDFNEKELQEEAKV